MGRLKIWKDEVNRTTITLPPHLKDAAIQLARLLDKSDPELLEFLKSRNIEAPKS